MPMKMQQNMEKIHIIQLYMICKKMEQMMKYCKIRGTGKILQVYMDQFGILYQN